MGRGQEQGRSRQVIGTQELAGGRNPLAAPPLVHGGRKAPPLDRFNAAREPLALTLRSCALFRGVDPPCAVEANSGG